MKFEVVDYRGKPFMCTEYAECVPIHKLDALQDAGFKFRVDGKMASKNQVLSQLGVISGDMTPASKSKRVRCVDTGKIYATQSEAARDLNIDPAQVSDSIKTNRRRSGYLFEKVTE